MIIERTVDANVDNYRVRFFDNTFESGLSKELFVFPLAGYKRQGCVDNNNLNLCVGDTVYINKNLATIMGFNDMEPENIVYAIKYATGIVDTHFTRAMLTLP